ncbi:hypothetical protein CNEO2_620022 [Clostridium neonatale]|nr:hypothetical protein CNEO2_620022 [Clostridium neonatale]CAI3631148.1 hypothetical protein CNEO4_600022 [Clostridium neonatale]
MSKKYHNYAILAHCGEIIKSRAHKQIKQSDYVLFWALKILFKKFLKERNKSHLFWKLRCGKGKEGSPQPLRDRKGVNLCNHLLLKRQLRLNLIALQRKSSSMREVSIIEIFLDIGEMKFQSLIYWK